MDEAPIDESRAVSPGCAPEARAADVGPGADEAGRVLDRLQRIETLDRDLAPTGEFLGELRELVHEAEAWARVGTTDSSGRPGLLAAPESTAPGAETAPGAPMVERKHPEEVEGMR